MTATAAQRAPETIAEPLLAWFDRYGRHGLPWQHPRTPYRVWVAEIMLQQTQVATVIDYFRAFMARFPDVHALAAAERDDVMACWAGLGYYARARNLHAAAGRIVRDFGGAFPRDVDTLVTLPGIGRSTAGAIVAQAFSVRAPILDGNAKRVLARLSALEATPGTAAFEKPLWALAERYTPDRRVADYTQAMMDLGATLCTRRQPDCGECPLARDCVARVEGRTDRIPAPRRRRRIPRRQTLMLVIRDRDGCFLFTRRPPTGIWGGLWCLPEIPAQDDPVAACAERFGLEVENGRSLAPVEHSFTHFRLTIHARCMHYRGATRIMSSNEAWFAPAEQPGLPAPVARLVESVKTESDPS